MVNGIHLLKQQIYRPNLQYKIKIIIKITLWKSNQLPSKSDQQYFFTNLAIDLNHLNQKLLHKIAHTDSRIRPDQRALENGNVEVAIMEKVFLFLKCYLDSVRIEIERTEEIDTVKITGIQSNMVLVGERYSK